MKKLLQLSVCALALLFLASPAFSQEYGIHWTKGVAHITTKTTTHIVTSTVGLNTLIINVSNAGTTWTVSVQDVTPTTPRILYAGTVATGTVVIELPVGIQMLNGIDIVTAGSTAGVMDVWYAYH